MTRRPMLLFGALFALWGMPVWAHGPTPQKAAETIVVASPPDAVWSLVGEFSGISSWHPGITSSAGSGENAAGAERTLTLKSGGVLVEGLDEYSADTMSYSYRLSKENLEALPVSFYSATLTVTPADGGGSQVEWLGRFYRGDTSNFPPDHLNDEAAAAAMKQFFREGLEGLKARLEAGQ